MEIKSRTKQIDELGRLVVPKDIRKKLDIAAGDEVELYTEGDSVIIKKALTRCVFCNETEGLVEYKGRFLCKAYKKELANQ